MSDPAVAITGMGCLFPGAPDVGDLLEQHPGRRRLDVRAAARGVGPDVYYDPEFADSEGRTASAAAISASLATFDPLASGSRRSASAESPTSGSR